MLKIVIIALLISSLAITYGAFIVDPQYRWILWLLISIVLTALIVAIIYAIYRYRKYKSASQTEQQVLLKQDKEIIAELFKLSNKALKNNLSSYKVPLYIMFGTEKKDESLILAQNDFVSVLDADFTLKVGGDNIASESDLYLKFWESDNATLIQLGPRIIDEEGADPDLWQEFIRILNKYRSQQACNGFIYTLGCSFVQTGDKLYHDKVIHSVRDAILVFNRSVGLKVPVFLALTKADAIKDFVVFYKYFADTKPEKPLGFVIKHKDRKQFDFEDYEAKCKQFVEYFSKNTLLFLKNIPEHDARSVLSFPYQMALFFNLLEDNIRSLTKENKLKKSVWLFGIYFLVPNQQDTRFDLLSQLIASRADFATDAKTSDSSYDKKRYFVANLFAQTINNYANLSGVNYSKKLLHIISYSVKLIVVLALIGYGAVHYYQNWRAYVETKDEMVHFIEQYHKEVTKISFIDDASLDDLVYVLERVRKKSLELDERFKFYQIVSYDQWAMPKAFKKFYQDELKQLFLRKLELVLRNSLYRLETTGNEDIIYTGAGAYMMLFDKKILDKDYFYEYIDKQVLAQIYFDSNGKTSLKKLIDDLFATNYDKSTLSEDTELVTNIKHKFDAVSVEDMLYELVKLDKRNSYKVDFMPKFGKNFSSIFSFPPSYKGYFIPFMFTREGFLSIDLSPSSPELKRFIKNLKLIKSNIDLSDESVRSIILRVQRKYYNDYIDHWSDIINNVEIAGFASFDEIKNAFEKINSSHNGALDTFIKVFVENTNLTKVYDTLKVDSSTETSQDLKPIQKNYLNGLAIASEFEGYYNFIGVNSDLEYSQELAVPYNTMMKDIQTIGNIYRQIDKNVGTRSKNVFNYVIKNLLNDVSNIDLLAIIDDDTPVFFSNVLTSLSNSFSSNISIELNNYLRERWNSTVLRYYGTHFNNKFPFALDTANEASIVSFEDFFKPNGYLDDFYKTYLSNFVLKNQDGYYEVNENTLFYIDVPYAVLELYALNDAIKSSFFIQDKLSLRFELLPRKLSSKAKLFEYKDGLSHCSYNQGPRQTCEVVWPANNTDITLSFMAAANSYSYGKRYKSEWGILKVILDESNSSFAQVVNAGAHTWIYSIDDYSIVYDVKVKDGDNQNVELYLLQKFQCLPWK